MHRVRTGLFILALVAVSWAGTPAVAAPAAGATAAPDRAATVGLQAAAEPSAWSYHFDALEEYRYRHATERGAVGAGELALPALPSEDDHDVRLLLQGDVRDPEDAFSANLSLALWADADGVPAAGLPRELVSMYDANQRVWFDVYTLQAQYRTDGVLAVVRGGRQSAEHGPSIVFDGAHVQLRAVGKMLEFFAFGGRTVHFFETGADLFEDWLGSGGVVVRPFRDLRFELDYRFQREDVSGIAEGAREAVTDHGYGLTAWYRPLHWLSLKAEVRGIADQIAQAGGVASFDFDRHEVGVTLSADAQPATLRSLAERSDPYFAILGESLPHVRARAEIWKAFTTDVGVYAVHLGWNGRFLTKDDPTRFNREYGRAYLLATANDIGVRGPFASLVVEYHYSHADDFGADGLFAVGGSVGWDRDPIRAEVGTYYERFKYDYFNDVEEVTDVRSLLADVRYRPLDWLSVRARYALEMRSDRDVHTVSLILGQSF